MWEVDFIIIDKAFNSFIVISAICEHSGQNIVPELASLIVDKSII